ncbi:MAG: sensor histidine kinase [Myxococcaceae bacterium]
MRRSSLRTQLVAAVVLPGLLAFAGVGWGSWVLARRALENQLGETLARQASLAATGVYAAQIATVQPGDETSQTRSYRTLLRTLNASRQASGARRIFVTDLEARCRADTEKSLPVGTLAPELSRDRQEVMRAQQGESTASQVLFTGADGRLYKTGYAPVRDSQGQVVGLLALEGSATFFEPLRQFARAYVALTAITLLLLALAAWNIASRLSRPIRSLAESALRIGQGDLKTPVTATGSAEVSVLGRELESMREALRARDRQLQMMLAGIAHEVRNPMGGMALWAGLLRETLAAYPPAQTASSEHLRHIQSELGNLRRVVEDFLAFAREQPPQRAPVSALELAASAQTALVADVKARTLRVDLDVEPQTIFVDETWVRGALINLLRNALQASPDAGVVTVRGKILENQYVFDIENGGPEISSENLTRVMEPFFTTKEKGTGLGLPLARKVARAHGGDVRLTSQPGKTVARLSVAV